MRTIIIALTLQKQEIPLLTHINIQSLISLNQIEPGIQTVTNMIHTKLLRVLSRLSDELLKNRIVR